MAATKMSHPYYPRDLLLPHYIPNENSLSEILGPFFGLVAVVLGLTWMYTGNFDFQFVCDHAYVTVKCKLIIPRFLQFREAENTCNHYRYKD